MFFGRKKQKEIAELGINDQSYWALVRKRFRKNKLAVWSLRILYGLIFFAVFGDFIANEKPIYCKIENETYFPVFRQYLVSAGLAKWDARFINTNWSEQEYESVLYPLIPYSAKTLDLKNTDKAPFSEQEVPSQRFTHWLGTDDLGRDIAAGLIYGVRIALMVGIISMGVATIIGILLGGVAGFFGDDQLQSSLAGIILNCIGIPLALFFGFGVRSYHIVEEGGTWNWILSFAIAIAVLVGVNLTVRLIDRMIPPRRRYKVPVDLIVMRLIEILTSIPGLIILLALLAIIEEASIVNVMIIIGLIGWTGIARFVRSELLRIRRLDYIEAARSMGFNAVRIFWQHAIPNALTPVLITIAFGIAGAILTEAVLTFLGIGIPPEEVSWGRMLYNARNNTSEWWLAIFPGMAIFMTITIFNLLGQGLTEALNPRVRN